jgi:hypothetical protein
VRAQDRDLELRQNCGDFKRVYVPENLGNKFTALCGYLGQSCESVCDWEGTSFPCSAVSLGGRRDGTRIALCRGDNANTRPARMSAPSGSLGTLHLFDPVIEPSMRRVVLNGVDTARPSTPFHFDWGDGTASVGFFPQTKMYDEAGRAYKIKVVATYPNGLQGSSETVAQIPEIAGAAKITSVGPISPKAWQTILIKGTHFGMNAPFNGCSDLIRVTDLTSNQVVGPFAPGRFCYAPILVTSWADGEIVIEGFPSFQRGQDAFKVGDVIKIEIGNRQQQGAPMAWYSARVTPGSVN